MALRLEALYRSGLLSDMNEVIGDRTTAGPLIEALAARKDIGLGEREAGCRAIARLAAPSAALPGRLKGETQLLAGYCAAAKGDVQTAEIAASLAREEGVEAELPLAVLAGFAAGTQPRLALPSRVLLLDYRFLELLGPVNAAQIVDKAEPALVAVLSQDAKVEPRVQLAAAEAALRLNVLQPQGVADVFRRRAVTESDAGNDPVLRRAILLRGIELSRSLDQQIRMASLLLGDAVRAGTRVQTAQMLAPVLQTLPPTPAAGPIAEMAVEITLAAGQFETARQWAQTADNTRHWLGLIDVADPTRRGGRIASLALMQDLAVRGRLGAETLHRLATVLDALDIDVPTRPVGRSQSHAAACIGLFARDWRLGRSCPVGAAQGYWAHHSARLAHHWTDRSGGRPYPGGGRCRARLAAHRARGRCAPAGAGNAASRLAAHGRELTWRQAIATFSAASLK